MKYHSLGLLFVAAACSKSSSANPSNRDEKPAVTAPAVPDNTGCDATCKQYDGCYERVNKGEHADHAQCISDCKAMTGADRAEWTANVETAVRKNKCQSLFDDNGRELYEGDDPARFACDPLPAPAEGFVVKRDIDLDGNGVMDAAIGPAPEDCGTLECEHDLYVAWGECFHPVGQVPHLPELLKTAHHGMFDVKISARLDGKPVSTTYRFDGKSYVGK